MKKLLVVAICVAGVVTGAAQGTFNFINSVGPVTDGSTGELAGAGVFGQVWAGASADSLSAVGSPVESIGFGLFNGGQVTVDGLAAGAAFVQLRAWSGGATFSEAEGNPAGFIGMSDIASINLVEAGGLAPAPTLPTGAFATEPVPEPSTYALAALGAGLLFLRRRK